MKTRAFSHLAIGVKDMETALGFYRDLLGLKVDLDRIERGGTQMRGGPCTSAGRTARTRPS